MLARLHSSKSTCTLHFDCLCSMRHCLGIFRHQLQRSWSSSRGSISRLYQPVPALQASGIASFFCIHLLICCASLASAFSLYCACLFGKLVFPLLLHHIIGFGVKEMIIQIKLLFQSHCSLTEKSGAPHPLGESVRMLLRQQRLRTWCSVCLSCNQLTQFLRALAVLGGSGWLYLLAELITHGIYIYVHL